MDVPFTCPQCGDDTEQLHEGYCEDCCRKNQRRLDDHIATLDAWIRMSDRERSVTFLDRQRSE